MQISALFISLDLSSRGNDRILYPIVLQMIYLNIHPFQEALSHNPAQPKAPKDAIHPPDLQKSELICVHHTAYPLQISYLWVYSMNRSNRRAAHRLTCECPIYFWPVSSQGFQDAMIIDLVQNGTFKFGSYCDYKYGNTQ